jgi:tryptophan synthase alpha chain
MKNPLTQRLHDNRTQHRPSLVLFATAGYPTLETTADLVVALEDAGADAVELGMPFSDPIADGAMIQQSSAAALANGVTIPWIFNQVSGIRKRCALPIILMGYLNPILRYGVSRFFGDAASAGVNGLILPEVPVEEWGRFRGLAEGHGLCGILLVAPTTTPERIRAIDEASSGFLYAVSSTGVTGGNSGAKTLDYVRKARDGGLNNPILVGFGISTPEQAVAVSMFGDGVVVGSALLRELRAGKGIEEVQRWVRGFRGAIDGVGTMSVLHQKT